MLRKLTLNTDEFGLGVSISEGDGHALVYLQDTVTRDAVEVVADKEDLKQIINLLESVVETLD